MKKIILMQCVLLLLVLYSWAVFAGQQAFLVQNSGWMEPFYADGHSEFKPLINAIVEAVTGPSESVTILAFNQTTSQNESPTIVYYGSIGTDLREAVQRIEPARKGVGKALADTDFNEAVRKTISGPFKGASGILWIFTNNKNSPNNSAETVANNREFYNLVHAEPSIARSLAFPLAMPVKGNVYSANGLMVYALAYGTEADAHLQAIIASNQLKRVITQQPAQLKPLDKDAVQLIPKSVINAPNTSAALGTDGRTLVLDIDVTSRQPVVQIVAGLENLFFPYRIASANIRAQIEGEGWVNELAVSPENIEELAPGSIADFTVAIPIRAELPKIWSLTSLLDFGRQIRISAVIRIRLENQLLRIDDTFRIRLYEIFPGDPLPEVFVPPATVRESTATIPLLIRVNYPLMPLVIAIISIISLLVMGLLFFSRGRSVGSYEIIVDGLTQHVSLGRFDNKLILNSCSGQQVGIIRRRCGAPTVESIYSGHTLSLRV